MFFKNRRKMLEQQDKIVSLLKENLELSLEIEECNEVSEVECGIIDELRTQENWQREHIEELKAEIKDSKHTEEILRESMLNWRKRYFGEISPLKKEILKLTRELQSAETIIALGDDTNKVLNERIQAVYDLVRPL